MNDHKELQVRYALDTLQFNQSLWSLLLIIHKTFDILTNNRMNLSGGMAMLVKH